MPHFSKEDDIRLSERATILMFCLDGIEEIISSNMDQELYGYINRIYALLAKFSGRMEVLQGTKE
jgi:hypothetical protein